MAQQQSNIANNQPFKNSYTNKSNEKTIVVNLPELCFVRPIFVAFLVIVDTVVVDVDFVVVMLL